MHAHRPSRPVVCPQNEHCRCLVLGRRAPGLRQPPPMLLSPHHAPHRIPVRLNGVVVRMSWHQPGKLYDLTFNASNWLVACFQRQKMRSKILSSYSLEWRRKNVSTTPTVSNFAIMSNILKSGSSSSVTQDFILSYNSTDLGDQSALLRCSTQYSFCSVLLWWRDLKCLDTLASISLLLYLLSSSPTLVSSLP